MRMKRANTNIVKKKTLKEQTKNKNENTQTIHKTKNTAAARAITARNTYVKAKFCPICGFYDILFARRTILDRNMIPVM